MSNFSNKLLILVFLLAVSAFAGGTSYAQSDVVGAKPQDVVVTNTATSPALVRDVDEAGKQPFQQQASVHVFGGARTGTVSIPVPAGKRLVIQHVSFMTQQLDLGNTLKLRIFTTFGGAQCQSALDLHDQQFSSTEPLFVANQPLLAYADGGTSVVVSVFLKTGQAALDPEIVRGTVTGYLLDANQAVRQ